MRNLLLFLFALSLFSCEKEPEVYNDIFAEIPESEYQWSLYYGKDPVIDGEPLPNQVEWLLVDATMYMDNLETGYKQKYKHFGPNRTTSSLRYSGAEYEIEIIELGVTTWEFRITGEMQREFILNHDTIEPYGFQETTSYRSIIEHPTTTNQQMGGSARPIVVYTNDYDEGLIDVRIQEAYEGINKYNWNYFTVLTFKLIDNE